MPIIEALGVFSTGCVVVWFAIYAWTRLEKYNLGQVTSVLAILFAGTILNFIQLADRTDFWLYPVGLLVGLVLERINTKHNIIDLFHKHPPKNP